MGVVVLGSTLSFCVFYAVYELVFCQIHRLLLGNQKPFVDVRVGVVKRVRVAERVGLSHQLFRWPVCYPGGFACCLTSIGLLQELQRSDHFLQA